MPDPSDVAATGERETGRLEAFSDGVIAVIITIMALELRSPSGAAFSDLQKSLPGLLIYALSFAFIGIYWNNHHHLLRATRRIDGAVMWANLHLLFWLSLIPVATEWVGREYRHPAPAAVYAAVALADALAYRLLLTAITRAEGPGSRVARAVGIDVKGWVSSGLYAAAVGLAFVSPPYLTYALLIAVAVMWLVPDRRLDRPGDPA